MTRASALVLLAAVALAGCGGDGERRGSGQGLIWDAEPSLVVPERLPDDRIVTGVVRNDSLRALRVEAKDLRLVDAEGRRIPGSAVFTNGYLHGLYPRAREPQLSDAELQRLGRRASLTPGKTVPLTVSWREKKGAGPPVAIDWGAGTLPLPD